MTEDKQLTVEDIVPKLQQLEQMLLEDNPEMPQFLGMINQDLRQYPELTYLLSDEQIKIIYSVIRRMTDVQIKVKKAKKSGKQNVLADGKSVADLL